jgi:hypothetical protein
MNFLFIVSEGGSSGSLCHTFQLVLYFKFNKLKEIEQNILFFEFLNILWGRFQNNNILCMISNHSLSHTLTYFLR